MSSSERRADSPLRGRPLLAAIAVAAALMMGGCTVRPLYGDVSSSIAPGTRAGLGTVSIKAVDTRVAQEVRNHLIFMLNGGAGEPASPRHYVDINVTTRSLDVAAVQVARENEPTAGSVMVTSNYTITDAATGFVVATGIRQVVSSFDQPRQGFALARALRDAENRAARELAEVLRLAIAQELEDLPA